LNETHGEKLGWQERKASSFTLSPLHCGAFFRVGYRRTDSGYGGPISLGTAMAVSGAAASPNMGYHSSPLLAFIMTFFTIRLGGWLPNPGPKGAGVWPKAHPTFSLKPLLSEALGFSTAESPFVNLSDGGHFENLGLYEMVARRCRLIVVSDAGADREFGYEDLGNALKKIRIDLGIPITFEGELLRKEKEGNPWGADGAAVQIGMIHYDAVDRPEGASEGPKNGCLIYLKPHLWKGAEDKPGLPPDILTYALAHPDFPHETTGDQFFTESQFEGYRALGFEVASAIPESRLSFTI
jgi:hypothetical protein